MAGMQIVRNRLRHPENFQLWLRIPSPTVLRRLNDSAHGNWDFDVLKSVNVRICG